VRRALEEYVGRVEGEIIEREIREACEFYFNEDKRLAELWSAVEPGVE